MQAAPIPSPRARQVKRVAVHQRVSYSRNKIRRFGNVVRAEGEGVYLVRFDDGSEKVCASGALRVESIHASLPPDVIPAAPSTGHEAMQVDEAQQDADAVDREEEDGIAPESSDDEDEQGNEVEENVGMAANEAAGQPGMIGQLPSESNVPKDYAAVKQLAKDKIAALVGKEVTVNSRSSGTVVWKVVAAVEPEDVIPERSASQKYGLKGFDISNHKKSEIFASIFLSLSFLDWRSKVEKMNVAVLASKAKTRLFSETEFLTGLGILIGAAEFAQRGCDLFSTKDSADEDELWPTLCGEPHFEKYMSFYRWKEFKRFLPFIFKDESRKETDPWWEFVLAVEEFNQIRSTKLNGSQWISVDETMSAWRPRKTALGGLPNISFIVRKPEPLGGLYFKLSLILN